MKTVVKAVKKISVLELQPGMILAEAVLNVGGTVELLAKGSTINKRHVFMLENLGIYEVLILEEQDLVEPELELTVEDHAELLTRVAQEKGVTFDADAYRKTIEELESHVFPKVEVSPYNQNMEVHVLTGENNLPLDVRHKVVIEETRAMFEQIKDTNHIDFDSVKTNVTRLLPDMVRNNDVLMRLKQLEESDDYTFQHSLRVGIMASMIGKWLGYSKTDLEDVATSGLLFDIGKMKIPEFVLNKKGPVTPEEYEIIKKHPQFSYGILLSTKGVSQNIKFGALQHHERIDGSGYPLRIKSGQIHEFAKILMVCDVYDALTHDRVYKGKISPFDAAEFISWSSGHIFDPRICYVFLSNLAEFYTGKDVLLNTGEKGRVIFVDVNYPTKPIIQVGPKFVDLSKNSKIKIEELL